MEIYSPKEQDKSGLHKTELPWLGYLGYSYQLILNFNFIPTHQVKNCNTNPFYFSIKSSKYIISRTEKMVLIFEENNGLFTLSTEIKTIV